VASNGHPRLAWERNTRTLNQHLCNGCKLRAIKIANTGFGVPLIAFGVVTEGASRAADLRSIALWIEKQPSWSYLPFVILTGRGGGPERNPSAARLPEILGNVSFVERPFHATTFISIARSALRGPRRQCEARQRIIDLD
jgi:hypothetical protein